VPTEQGEVIKVNRAIAALLVAVGLLVSAATAGAEPVPRLASLESPTASPFDFDQVSKRCATSTATRNTTLAYSGSASLKVHTENDPACGGAFARGILRANSTRHLVEGDDFWFGAAIYLPTGFYSAHTSYTDLLRVDSYVHDDSTSTPFADRAEINFASWNNDSLNVVAARGDTSVRLIGPISPAQLPEGSWNWVELHVKLSPSNGTAYTELKINGKSLGSSTTANLFAGAAPLNRFRYGIVSTSWNGSGNLTAYFDRASISPTERGPIPPPSTEPEPTPSPEPEPAPPAEPEPTPSPEPEPAPSPEPEPMPSQVSRWRLDELSGVTAWDAMGTAPGLYVNEPTLGVEGIVGDRLDTATSFDGVDDYVTVAPTAPLDMEEGLTLEAWVKADAFRGSMIQRNNSYELRPQGSGSVLFRVWTDGTIRALSTAPETLSPGDIHYLVGTYDGESMKIYVDGALVASRLLTGPISHDPSPLYIGRNGRLDTYFKGIIDEVAIYSEALSASTILDRFERGKILG
jgi:Concanavalin A-like lectin/glucanases superfamily/Polysaccharide lyase